MEDAHGTKSSPDVFVGRMADGCFAAVLFARSASANMTLSLADLAAVDPQAKAASYKVRDLWAHSDNGTVASTGALTVLVGGEDVVMVKLTPVQHA